MSISYYFRGLGVGGMVQVLRDSLLRTDRSAERPVEPHHVPHFRSQVRLWLRFLRPCGLPVAVEQFLDEIVWPGLTR